MYLLPGIHRAETTHIWALVSASITVDATLVRSSRSDPPRFRSTLSTVHLTFSSRLLLHGCLTKPKAKRSRLSAVDCAA